MISHSVRVRPEPSTAKAVVTLVAFALAGCTPTGQADETTAAPPTEAVADVGGLAAFTAAISVAEIPALDREMALTLVAMPLSCLDRPHAAPQDRRGYLDTIVTSRVPGYEKNRAFYGCWDWHSAVNSTWAMVRMYKEFPDLPLGGLIDEKLGDHLSADALEGERAFFEDERSFERPYGWGWLLALQAELASWDHPDASAWADRVEPLARLFSERTIEWLDDLQIPSRSGAHANTAFALAMMLDAARSTGDLPLEEALERAAVRLFEGDLGCPTAYEPWGSDFLSPCLEEAALMAAVLDQAAYLRWLDDFLPAIDSREFAPLTSPTNPEDVVDALEDGASSTPAAAGDDDAADGGNEAAEDRLEAAERRYLASASHLIGLAFIRADAMNRIASALPAHDPRIPALRRLALRHGSKGFDALFDADYAGSHWIGTFALKYLLSEQTAPPCCNP
jgi:hypothetical protein